MGAKMASVSGWDLEAREVVIVEKIDIIFLRHDGVLALTNQRVLFQASHATDRTVSLPLSKIKGASSNIRYATLCLVDSFGCSLFLP